MKVLALYILLMGTAYADWDFAVEISHNGKVIGNAVPEKGETYQKVVNNFYSEYFHRWKVGDDVVFKIYYPKYGYESHFLYGCMIMNKEGGIIGWVSKNCPEGTTHKSGDRYE